MPLQPSALRVASALVVGLGAFACDPTTPMPEDGGAADAAPIDARSPSVDASIEPPIDGALDDASPAGDAGPAACTEEPAWIAALADRDPTTTSVLVAPGLAWSALRDALASSTDPHLPAVLASIRARASGPAPTLTPAGTPVYQSLASHALAAAWVGFVDDDAAARDRALAALETAGVAPEFWAGAPEVTIRVGASLVALAGAVDLLGAADPSMRPAARDALGRALDAVVAWYRTEGELFAAPHADNFTLRLGAGVVASALLLPSTDARAALVRVALAGMARTLDDVQTGGEGRWREGPFYLAYGMEVAPLAWAALDAAWTARGDVACVECPDELLAACAASGVRVVRPSTDPVLPALVRWMGHLEGAGGWLVPFDDARPVAWIPAPLERLAGVRSSRAWSPSLPNALGGSVQVGPFVAAALARGTAALPEAPRAVTLGGVAHLEGEAAGGGTIDAFLVAEDAHSAAGGGHERLDPLALVLSLDGHLVMGPGGYESYDLRDRYRAPEQSSLVTIAGLVPEGLSTTTAPGARLEGTASGATGTIDGGGATWSRAISLDGGTLVVHDHLRLDAPRAVTWHWHTRGTLDASERRWVVDGEACEIEFVVPGIDYASLAPRREDAPHSDDGRGGATHAVLRFGATFSAGDVDVTTRIACTRP